MFFVTYDEGMDPNGQIMVKQIEEKWLALTLFCVSLISGDYSILFI